MSPSRYGDSGPWQHRFYAFLIVYWLAGCALPGRPAVIGPVETLRVREAGLAFRGLIDTGSAASSIHALDIRVEGALVSFTLENEQGERRPLSADIVDVATVRTAQGTDVRPRVALHLSLGGVEKRVLVSLRDRTHMDYKLLVGRDFLAGDFVVDVARGEASR